MSARPHTLYADPSPMIVERGYLDHWKTNLLRSLTSSPSAAELPIRLWEHCEARMDDFIEDRDGLVVCGICRWAGDPKQLLDALIRCRWIEKKQGGFIVHGWRDRQRGKFASRLNGQKGGRPKKASADNPQETKNNLQVSNSEPKPNQNGKQVNLQGGEMRGEEKSREPADLPLHASVRESLISDTWTFILGIFGKKKKRAISYLAKDALDREITAGALPLSDEQREILTWFYAQPHDPKCIELRGRFDDEARLAENLLTSISRAEAYAKKTGRPQKKEAAVEMPGWREAMAAVWPGGEIPETWEEFLRLGASIRQPVLDRLNHGGTGA